MAAFQRTILCRAAKCRQRARGIRIGVLGGKALVGGIDEEESSLIAADGPCAGGGEGMEGMVGAKRDGSVGVGCGCTYVECIEYKWT